MTHPIRSRMDLQNGTLLSLHLQLADKSVPAVGEHQHLFEDGSKDFLVARVGDQSRLHSADGQEKIGGAVFARFSVFVNVPHDTRSPTLASSPSPGSIPRLE